MRLTASESDRHERVARRRAARFDSLAALVDDLGYGERDPHPVQRSGYERRRPACCTEALLQRLAVRVRDGTGDLIADAVEAAANFDGHGVSTTPEEVPTS